MFRIVSRFAAPVWLAACCLLAPSPSQAVGQVRKAPAPSWVEAAALPAPRAERDREVSDGQYTLLVDRQVRADGSGKVSYRRDANLVTDRGGLEAAASVSIDFDPSDEDVVLHHVRVWRAGIAQDRLKDVSVDLIRRERQLADGVITGMKTAHFELRDVRVGDIVDVAYSLDIKDKVLQGQLFDAGSTSWSAPVGLTRFRILWPHGRPLTVKLLTGAPHPAVSQRGGFDVYDWRIEDANPIQGETDTPPWRRPWGEVVVSSMGAWAEVSAWALPLYRHSDQLPAGLAAEADQYAAANPDPRDRITWALRHVQDNVRYVSLSIGVGSYLPRSPAEVIRTGFGDCKDKARLLVAMLQRLGVVAVPVLVDTDLGAGLADQPPAPTLFDHMVVRVTLNARTYWVDPTRSHEGGRFPDTRPLSYAWGLPVVAGQDRLEAIPFAPPSAPTLDVVETYELPTGPGPLKLSVATVYRAEQADWMRANLASKSPAEFEKLYLAFYGDMYPGLTSARPIQIEDDRNANRLRTIETYGLSAEALAKDGLIGKFLVKASALDDYKSPAAGERRTALSLPYPVNKHHRIVLVTPGRKPPMPEAVEIDGVGFHYRMVTKREGDVLTLDYRLTGSKPVLEPGEAKTFKSELDQVADANFWRLDLTSRRGGVIGGGPGLVALALGLGALLAAGLVFALRRALVADAAHAQLGYYYPVGVTKFSLMSVATFGLYGFFWVWKCWRWAKSHGHADIQPFWRAAFRPFWLYPLFAEANQRPRGMRMPAWIGGVASAVYFAWLIASAILNESKTAPPLMQLSTAFDFVCYYPALLAVNRLNRADGEALAANSKFTGFSAVALVAGAAAWTLVLVGLNS